ncbi:MAG: signaling protein, partial [Pedosphaera sp.]|nr:signaling protein [Pedosphaera sp.]
RYDVIFLDVRMPGMDGFELCSKIRETALNPSAPVVFVTSLRDFETRAKSLASSGTDLIAKPFLTFEIAVKALTLVLGERLQTRSQIAEAVNQSDQPPPLPAAVPPAEIPVPVPAGAPVAASIATVPTVEIASVPPPAPAAAPPAVAPATPDVETRESLAMLLPRLVASLGEARRQLLKIGQSSDGLVRQEILGLTHLCIRSLTSQLDRPELRPAFQLGSALERLLKRFHDKPESAAASALHTAAAAVDLLEELCLPGVKPDLATAPAIKILVVDDEPLARRAVVGSLENAFFKPDSAADGQVAIALAATKPYDLIFMDAEMPGMDGFTACARVRATALNQATPVVFVTSHTDARSRGLSAASGGNDFVVKPFLFAELTVKALTIVLRGRLQKSPAPLAAPSQSPQQ